MLLRLFDILLPLSGCHARALVHRHKAWGEPMGYPASLDVVQVVSSMHRYAHQHMGSEYAMLTNIG